MTVQQIIDNARLTLQDYAGVKWTATDMVSWINAAVREIVNLSPRATTLVLDVPLVGGTKQSVTSLPGNLSGISFVDAICNMGTSGVQPGDAINSIDRQSIDAMIPGWHYDSPSKDSIYYVSDTMFPSTYFLYPPRPASSPGYARIVATVRASALEPDNLEAAIPIGDQYSNSIVDYVLFRCFSENMAVPNAPNRAQFHISAFTASLKGADAAGIFVPAAPAPAQAPVTQ